MITALNTAATGMEAQQTKIDVISNNLANVNTTGFKKSRADFQDLLYQDSRIAGSQATQDTQIPTGTQIGHGVRTAGVTKIYETGDISKTGNQLDLAIEGPGFFRIRMQDGETAYTRAGAFKLNGEGQIVTSDGHPLASEIAVPEGTTEISVGEDGTVTAFTGDDQQGQQIGNIELARFTNPAGLESMGSNLHQQTPSSGEALVGLPGQNGLGKLSQGYLEDSNVSVMKEMVSMISAQRAYETNSKAVQAADTMLQTTNRMA